MSNTLSLIALAVLVILLVGCAPRSGSTPGAGRVSAAEAKTLIAEHPEALVLDVRGPGEWNDDVGHIDGARLIPLPELESRLSEIAAWKDKPVVAVCRVGARSGQAARLLARSGFTNVVNLDGGMVAWRRAGY